MIGRPAVVHLTPGNASDVKTVPEVIAAAPGRIRRLLADRGYDADALRHGLRAMGTTPVIPGRRSRKRPVRHDSRRYRGRWAVEAAICRLKDFRRVATRYDKLAANFASAAALAAVVAFWARRRLAPWAYGAPRGASIATGCTTAMLASQGRWAAVSRAGQRRTMLPSSRL